MKIVTVNVPESYIAAMKRLVDNETNGLYPSRSELIRVAVRKFLIKELKMAKKLTKFSSLPELTEEDYVRVPINKLNEKDKPIREFKTFKVLRRLD